MKKVDYINSYGALTLIAVSDLMLLKKVSTKFVETLEKDKKESLFLPMEICEQIALITENKKIQICFSLSKSLNENCAYVFLHESPSTGWVCKVASLEYLSPVGAQEKLEQELQKYSYPCF